MGVKTKAIFFDLFETLITEFADGKRVSARSYDYMGLLGIGAQDFKHEWSSRQKKRMTGEFANYFEVVKDIMASRGLPYTAAAVENLYRERVKEKQGPFLQIRPDIIELLQWLRDRRIKIGLISNCTEEEVAYWRESSLAPYFDSVNFSYEVGVAKPDLRIYQLACERLAVAPEEAIFVGDGGSRELEGAYRAGMTPYHAVWFNTYIASAYKKIKLPADVIEEIE
jgi:putative hydrolase of the HAD superfamily